MTNFIGPDGNQYSLTHLAPFEHSFALKINAEETLEIPLWVSFRDHCYTREVAEGDDMTWLIPGTRRMFCRDRWTYSQGVPSLLRNLINGSTCYRTTQSGHYFRLEKSSRRGASQVEGWYLFFKFSRDQDRPGQLNLSVESIHDRTSWPSNARGNHPLRFWAALKEFLMTRPDVLEEVKKASYERQSLQKEKAPE